MTATTYDQIQSPLFNLPSEIRQLIYFYTLSSYENPLISYNRNTCWYRPGCQAPLRCDTALLRACQRIYDESWHVLWENADLVFWLTKLDRCPPGVRPTQADFLASLAATTRRHGPVDAGPVRFYAQMFSLEWGTTLSAWLDPPDFHPRSVTISIRHTDWWNWEQDETLRIDSGWARACRFPDSVCFVAMELESLQRKRLSIDSVVEQMKAHWYLTTRNNDRLSARNTAVDTRTWQGSSTWAGARWIRDETAPETITYHVATVKFERERERGSEHESFDHPDNFDLRPIHSTANQTQYPNGNAPTTDRERQHMAQTLLQQRAQQLAAQQAQIRMQQQAIATASQNQGIGPAPHTTTTRMRRRGGGGGRPFGRVPGQLPWRP